MSRYPNCLQTTLASTLPHKSSQTVPHRPLLQTSTRPSISLLPFTNLMSPLVHSVFQKVNSSLRLQTTQLVLQLTWWRSHKRLADHTGIFKMYAVVTSNRISWAVSQPSFSSSTLDIVQPDRSSPLTKCRKEKCSGSYERRIIFNLHLIGIQFSYQYHGIPTAYRLHWHRQHSRSHHTLCPTLHCYRTPLVPRS